MSKLYEKKSTLRVINICIEAIIVFASYWIATLVRFVSPIGDTFSIMDSVIFMILAISFTVAFIISSYVLGVYYSFHASGVMADVGNTVSSTIIGILANCTIVYFLKFYQFSRVLMIYFAVVTFVLVLLKRIILSKIVRRYTENHSITSDVLMIGSGEEAEKLYKSVLESHMFNLRLAGYIGNEKNETIPGYIGDYSRIKEIILNNSIYMIIIVDAEIPDDMISKIVYMTSNHGIRLCILPQFSKYMLSKNSTVTLGDMTLCELTALEKCEIMGVNISVTNMDKTVDRIKDNIEEWRGKYICVSNVHTTVTAFEDEKYKEIQNKAVITLPDGGPLSAFSREKGYKGAKRVTGPDLMKQMLKESENTKWRHFFYGSTQETLDKLRSVVEERYPGAEICGMISPPFRLLTVEEDKEIVKQINEAKPDFVWIGLGAPKQEIWMAAHEDRINALMVGVGAAFDYESGNIKRAPEWMQKRNLEWLYRLIQDPKRLFKRYFATNTKYLLWKMRQR